MIDQEDSIQTLLYYSFLTARIKNVKATKIIFTRLLLYVECGVRKLQKFVSRELSVVATK